LTEELRLEAEEFVRRKREKQALQKRNQRAGVKRVDLTVMHYDTLKACLIDAGLLTDLRNDGGMKSRVDAAVASILGGYIPGALGSIFDRRPRLGIGREGIVTVTMDVKIIDRLVWWETDGGRHGDPAALRSDGAALIRVAERWLFVWYSSYEPSPHHPCDCDMQLNYCECERWRYVSPPLTDAPRWKKPYKPKMTANRKTSTAKRDDDPVVRQHARVAGVGFKGKNAGTTMAWKITNAEYNPDKDDRATSRDRDKTAREGEKELEKPFDAPTGTPKSWAIRSDVEPNDDKGVQRIGQRIVEDGRSSRSQ
jgi:hypothetical protein